MTDPSFRSAKHVFGLATVGLSLLLTPSAIACPFCNAVSQTLRQELSAMDAVVIASAAQTDVTRDKDTGEILMKVEKVLKGTDLVTVGQDVRAVYYGDVSMGRRFLLSGVDPPNLQWSCLPVTERSEAYVAKIPEVAEYEPVKRLQFYYDFLQDDESLLARDAYDEFAIAPYDVVKQLAPHIDHDKLVEWITDPEMSTDRKRLYLTMLGVCGSEKDLPMLEEMLRSTKKSTRGGLDALIACYLTLGGEKGLPLIDELFLDNASAPYADTYAAIMAIRFHGTEGDIIQRSALVESLHHVLNRKDLADLVIPDLARWQDWSQIDRLTKLFIDANADNNWIRVPVINYMRACPLDEAKEAMKKLEEVDPDSVKRANTFFSIPVPARDTGSSDSSVRRHRDGKFAGGISDLPAAKSLIAKPGQQTADVTPLTTSVRPSLPGGIIASAEMNPWQLVYVLFLAISTLMIAQFLLLAGGTKPAAD